MWFVKYGSRYLHDPRIGLILPVTKPTVELNTSTTFTFSVAHGHPLYDVIRERDPDNAVTVYQGHDIVYKGEITNIEMSFNLTKSVTCNSDLGFFNGSIVRPYSTVEGECSRTAPSTINGYFEFLVNEHNRQSSVVRQFKMGINQGDQIYPGNYIYRSNTDYPTVGSTIKDEILEELGGYLRIRYEEDDTYIDLLSDMPDVNAQVIDFGVNLLDYTDETNSEDIASFVVPVGKDIEKAADDTDTLNNKLTISKDSIPYLEVVVSKRQNEWQEANDSLYSANQSVTEAQQKLSEAQASGDAEEIQSAKERLESAQEQAQSAQEKYDSASEALQTAKDIVEDAKIATVDRTVLEGYFKSGDIIYSTEAVKKYGWIGAMVSYSDVTTVSNLITYGLISLRSLETPIKTIELTAFDLSMIDPNAKPIKLGEYVRARSKPHGVDSYFLCTKIEYDLNNPSNNKFTLGTTFDTLTGQQNKRIKALNATINNVYEAANKISSEAKDAAKKAEDALDRIASLNGKYLHIAYSANEDGSDFTSTPDENSKYIGIYSGNSETPPTSASEYTWSLFKGSDGVGIKGEDGKSAYLHIKYSNDGKTFTGNDGEDPGDWIGTCTDENEDDPTGFESYTWKLIKGEDGQNGKDGTDGKDGADGVSPVVSIVKEKNYSTITIIDKDGTHTTDIYDGENGTPGEPGADGRTTYFHVKYSNDGGKTFTNNKGEDPGDYLGSYTDYTEKDSENVSDYTWVLVKGEDGEDGNGVQSSSVSYQASTSGDTIPTGTWSSTIPTVTTGQYLWTRTTMTFTDGTVSHSYSVSRIGKDGEKGKDGTNGKDGKDGADGYSPAVSITKDGDTTTISIVDKDGTHTQVVKDGTNGTPGEAGEDGKTTYFHVKYSNDGGKTFTGNQGEDSGDYLGTYTDYTEADSTNVSDYTWVKIKGEKGDQGIQGIQGEKGEDGIPGTNGVDGKTSYFHIKYSSVANPTSSSQISETPNTYIGTYVDFVEKDSTDPSKYTWSKFEGSQGEKGEDGIPGTNGVDGKTSYLHIAYANSADGKTGFSVSESTGKTYIGQYTDFVKEDSSDYTKYSWTKIKGENGQNGEDGNGIESTEITYQASTSGDSIPTGTWRNYIPTVASGYYLWTRTVLTYTDGTSSTSYSVGMVGKNGTDGVGVKSTEITYQAGSSATDIPTGMWSTDMPTPSAGTPYIWTRTITTYTNNTTSTSYSVGCTPEGIQVGGRNMLLRSRTLESGYYNRSNASFTYEDMTVNGIVFDVAHMQRELTASGQYSNYQYINKLTGLKADTTYILSFWAKGNGVVESMMGSHIKQSVNSQGYTDTRYDGHSLITLTDDWERYWVQWTTSSDFAETSTSLNILYTAYSTSGHASEWYMYAPKFEIGNKATDWTPAPEDVDGEIKDLDTSIRDTIADTAKDTLDASKDLMDDKLKDYLQNGEYDSFKQSVEAKFEVMDSDIEMNFNTTTELINSVDSSLNTKFTELTKYIRFSNDGIEIGASENELKLTLDNDMIKFTKNGEPVGWWDGNDFHTGNLVVEVNEHAQFGNFSFVPRSDGSLMFLKVKD